MYFLVSVLHNMPKLEKKISGTLAFGSLATVLFLLQSSDVTYDV